MRGASLVFSQESNYAIPHVALDTRLNEDEIEKSWHSDWRWLRVESFSTLKKSEPQDSNRTDWCSPTIRLNRITVFLFNHYVYYSILPHFGNMFGWKLSEAAKKIRISLLIMKNRTLAHQISPTPSFFFKPDVDGPLLNDSQLYSRFSRFRSDCPLLPVSFCKLMSADFDSSPPLFLPLIPSARLRALNLALARNLGGLDAAASTALTFRKKNRETKLSLQNSILTRNLTLRFAYTRVRLGFLA